MLGTSPMNGRSSWIWVDHEAYNQGSWSSPTNTGDNPYLMAYFRRTFTAPKGATLSVHVSADSRYILWCNGVRVGRGPAKGDVRHHFYDSYDLSEHLCTGENVLAAQVVSYARVRPHVADSGAPNSIMSEAWIFALEGGLLDGGGAVVEELDTNSSWKATPDTSYVYQHREGWGTYLGMFEDMHGERFPHGWRKAGYDDSRWRPAYEVACTTSDGDTTGGDPALPHVLTPRTIAPLEETPRRFDGVARADLVYPSGDRASEPEQRAWAKSWEALASSGRAVTVPANTLTGVTLWCDVLQTGFPELRVRNGRGARIRLTYSEALTFAGEAEDRTWREFRGRIEPRHAPDEGHVIGYWDEYRPGGRDERYEPFWWRTFRYVHLEVETGASPVTIDDLSYRFTAYPFEEKGRFVSSDNSHARMWELSWRTARLCAHETYEDCPYYEQLQYAGDTHVQSLISYYVAGDASLARQAVRHFDWSRNDDGLTKSRYPSRNPQFIPTWSLLWIAIVRDYWWHTGDLDEVTQRVPGIAATLDWFQRYENDDGLLEALPHWKVVDWVKEWDPSGYPPGADGGVSTLLNMQYAYALRLGSEVAQAAGDKWHANLWKRRAKKVADRVDKIAWWPEEGLYRDRVDGDELSELTQAWAILAELPSRARIAAMLEHLGTDTRLAPATLYGRFYVLRALSAANRYDLAYDFLDHWRNMMRTDLTTWPEEPHLARSYCHAWSAAPIYDLLSEVLGVKPASPGFESIVIRPTAWNLTWAEGRVPTPKGDVTVRWDIERATFHLTASGPKGVPIEVVMPDGSRHESVGATGRISTPTRR